MGKITVYDNHTAFWGSFLSNFHPCEFEFNEIFNDLNTDIDIPHVKWKSSEQCFMAYKAKVFNDYESLMKICMSKTPNEAKKIGRKVKNYDDKVWADIRRDIMKKIIFEKFAQNNDLKTLLLSEEYRNKKFVEGSPFDKIWGVGMRYSNPKIDDENNWNGTNLLGQILTEIRDEFLNE